MKLAAAEKHMRQNPFVDMRASHPTSRGWRSDVAAAMRRTFAVRLASLKRAPLPADLFTPCSTSPRLTTSHRTFASRMTRRIGESCAVIRRRHPGGRAEAISTRSVSAGKSLPRASRRGGRFANRGSPTPTAEHIAWEREKSEPPPSKPRSPQANSQIRAAPHEPPQKASAMVFDHQNDRPLVEPEMPRRHPCFGIAGFLGKGRIKGRLETVRVRLGQFGLVNTVAEHRQDDLGRERQRRHDRPRRDGAVVRSVRYAAPYVVEELSLDAFDAKRSSDPDLRWRVIPQQSRP